MSKKTPNKPPNDNTEVRCEACFSIGRNLRRLKDVLLMTNICPLLEPLVSHCRAKGRPFPPSTYPGLWLTGASFVQMYRAHRAISSWVYREVAPDSLSTLQTSETFVITVAETRLKPVPKRPVKMSQRIQFEDSDSELEIVEDSNDNWSDSRTPIKRPDNTKTSKWLQQEKGNVPKIVGTSSMTLKDMLNQPLQYPAEKQPDSTNKSGTSSASKDGESKNGGSSDSDEGSSDNGLRRRPRRICEKCDFRFYKLKAFKEHMAWHLRNKTGSFCKTCRECFINKELFDKHNCKAIAKKRNVFDDEYDAEDRDDRRKKYRGIESYLDSLSDCIQPTFSSTAERKTY
ncbi:unnamed protein product [Chrysodeixis includens]|uniref:C2H2-type domain-containing protein n=1 Tax=Chrysodeixis includens TaxID=689277 RepID=A0A9P0C2H9_CHRIL|nr:unnamed protein product [Chrysodeixis includens]